MKSKWITYSGQRIFFSDLSDFGDDYDAVKRELDESDAVIMKEPKGSVRVLLDIRDTVASKDVVDLFKVSANRTKPYVDRIAIIGITGVRKVLYRAVMRISKRTDGKLFDDHDSAKKWLVADDA